MSLSLDFCIARAEEAAKEARAASLDNVRERALRSEAAWRDMADRAEKVVVERQAADALRAQRREEEQLAAVVEPSMD